MAEENENENKNGNIIGAGVKPVSQGTKPGEDLGAPDTKNNNTSIAKVRKHKTLGAYKKMYYTSN